ncbi:protein FAR1-RELATED SEQUENCE 5-like [Pyrus ussuriensis x Pyrus communis]|uniref:Protein FAR1-RELATED SEQUENCE 5-like n=1 Tax=Pyrus ussuriensis x Pyrus communis TaxID=2448454 RepID=A0A5N5GK37_9ROSA|nr:protein FAR1-RELATED SEQUENCE 5-like [Pyrus ussuriensis x Pyrus communis]
MCGHLSCRHFSQEEILRIKEMSKAGIQPHQILSSLRQGNPHLQVVSRNIYNQISKIVKESLARRPVIQALLEELGEGGFTYNIEYDHEGHLTHLIFAHPLSIELTKSYSYVFVRDCTYKNNKYMMPLLDIVGVSSFNTSFYSCFVFMQNEKEEYYVWALKMFSKILGVDNHPMVIITDSELALMNAIRIVFPSTSNLLCVWHIEKNILANCKAYFEEEVDWIDFISTWTILIQSPNETSFNEAWSRFEVKYKERKFVLKYILSTWLPYKEKFVSAWSEKVTHFGNCVTSRAEGAHATLKKYLQVSTRGLREVKEKICLAIENQFQEIKTQLSSEKVRVVTHVSRFALNELYNQHEASSSCDLPSLCKGQFLKTMGLPCAHMIKEMNIEVLQLNDIHPQWRIDRRLFVNDRHVSLDNERDQISGLLLEIKDKYEKLPLTQKEGYQKATFSTKRGPSKFEIVEKAQKCARQVCHFFIYLLILSTMVMIIYIYV